jgi:hypothetical protein
VYNIDECFVFDGVSIKAVSKHYYQLYTACFNVCQLHVKEFSVDSCHLLNAVACLLG